MTVNLAVLFIVSLVAIAAASRSSTPPLPEGFAAGICDLKRGDRVERGPTWTWGNEDSCNVEAECADGHCLGTIDEMEDFECGVDCHWYLLNWDCGFYNYYRQGGDKCDVAKTWKM